MKVQEVKIHTGMKVQESEYRKTPVCAGMNNLAHRRPSGRSSGNSSDICRYFLYFFYYQLTQECGETALTWHMKFNSYNLSLRERERERERASFSATALHF